MTLRNGTKLLCINDTKQRIVVQGRVYTAFVRDGISAGKGKTYIQEHKRFAFSLDRFEVIG